MDGTVDANRVEIKAGGHVSGEIISSELIIESKGIFEGNSVVKNSAQKQQRSSEQSSATIKAS